MNQELKPAEGAANDVGDLIMDRPEYLAMLNFADLFGENLSVPILYEPR